MSDLQYLHSSPGHYLFEIFKIQFAFDKLFLVFRVVGVRCEHRLYVASSVMYSVLLDMKAVLNDWDTMVVFCEVE